jgi:hypothetical protein
VSASFEPGVPGRRNDLERAHKAIRTHARRHHDGSGSRTIGKLSYRRDGADLEAEVGEREATAGKTVIAIHDLGSGVYAIQCDDTEPLIIGRHHVYSVTERTA